jgi:hypothetical protein
MVSRKTSLKARELNYICASRNSRLGLPELTSWQQGSESVHW